MKILVVLSLICNIAFSQFLLIPMDYTQTDHLKAYGVTYHHIDGEKKIEWLLNYRGGSFILPDIESIRNECLVKDVKFEKLGSAEYISIREQIEENNMEIIPLEKAPKIAVYTPESKQPWDDAVTMALSYADVKYDKIYDRDIINGNLIKYDWLHLHHEDFTGQYGKFFGAYRNAPWYIEQKRDAEILAKKLGYNKVSEEKLAVASKIRDYVIGGGFMFAMCSATDSFDIALASEGIDICEPMFDGDESDANYQALIDYRNSFAFKDFNLERNPMVYEFSDIDTTNDRQKGIIKMEQDYFSLMDFSAKWDPIPTMLCQNHTQLVKGFMGQTTAFASDKIKSSVLLLGENKINGEARYIHGTKGKGMFTFYGGHDPEDYQHRVGDAPTVLDLHPNSPGYRLILNNVLFPAARKKKLKT